MGVVTGRVVAADTGRGIPNVVAVISASAGTPAEEGLRVMGLHKQLGSVLTGASGEFSLDYGDVLAAAGRTAIAATAWDLTINVFGSDAAEQITPLAVAKRRNAGQAESFIIRVPANMLGGVRPVYTSRPPQTPIPPEERKIRARNAFASRLDQQKAIRGQTKVLFTPFLRALSATQDTGRSVQPGESVEAATLAGVRRSLPAVATGMTVDNAAVLDDQTLAELRAQHGNTLSRIPASAIESRVWPQRQRPSQTLIRIDPMWWCRKLVPVNDCVKILDPDHQEQPPPPEPGPDPGQPPAENPPEPATIEELVSRLTATLTSPEEKVLFGVRPAVSDVQGSIDGLSLRGGPADVPATYDFHQLRIAFEPIWQELFDEGLLHTGQQLYDQLVEVGKDPNEYLIDDNGYITFPYNPGSATPSYDVSPPAHVVQAFEITNQEWAILFEEGLSEELEALAKIANGDIPEEQKPQLPFWIFFAEIAELAWAELKKLVANARAQGERMIKYARTRAEEPREFSQFHDLLLQLNNGLKAPYRFNIYAANGRERSINFGVIATFRQRWTPQAYQVGELVKTVPLAPKEVRRYTKKSTTKVSRAEREVRNSLEARRTESSETSRVETEIIRKAQQKTNFSMSAEGGFNMGVANASGKTGMSHDAAQESSEAKKEFRESVFKASAEYKAEHILEVNVSEATEFGWEESGEISNPNDELPVTYLFYQLQRRYRIEEKLKKVTPIVLVAQEFPRPNDIDDDWIVAHDWILRRVILDDSFLPAMSYLASKVVGDEHALRELFENVQQQRRLVEEAKGDLVATRNLMERRYRALQKSMQSRADAIDADENESMWEELGENFHGSDDVTPEAMKVREDAARDAFERASKKERDNLDRLQHETGILAELTQVYTGQLSEHLNRRTQISRLRTHIKANIMYYMQAIWSHEVPDQRYFRLRDVKVPRLGGQKTYDIVPDPDAIPLPPTWTKPHKLKAHIDFDANNIVYDRLGDVADLDNLLGFKGNYMIFPLTQENALTDFMMTPYYDPFTGLRDPDVLAAWTLHEFAEYVCCLRKHLSDIKFEALLPGLIETYRRLREKAADDGELVVPTDSLYIEALPGVHPILEDFKLAHRAIDVKKVQAEVRSAEMENLRMAARLLTGEHEDPQIDKRIVIEGTTGVAINPDQP